MLRRILAVLTLSCSALVPVAALFLTPASPAHAASPNIVISQVYGGGGNTSAPYTNDFVELFNRGNSTVSVAGWSVQYASAAGTGWAVNSLSGSIPPGGYYLVQLAGGAIGVALPTPNATGTSNMSGTAGKVALVNLSTALAAVACPANANIIDFVGYGGTANCFEGAAAPAPSNTSSILRAGGGCVDSDANSTNFSTGAPNPRNSASTASLCNIPDLTINDVTVAEGNAGTTTFTFTVSLSSPAGVGGVSFNIATADGTATAGVDYTAKSLTSQTIAQGMSTYTFTVVVNGDLTPELNETFFVNIINLVGALPVDVQGLGTITNDDAAPNLTINSVSLNEGNSAQTTYTFTVSLSTPAPAGGVTFNIATADVTATAPSDYTANSLMAQTIPEGSTTYTFNVLVNGDATPEGNETFQVNVTGVVNAIVVSSQGVGTILNDDVYRISAVQGSSTASPLVGQVVLVEGIVTGVFQGLNSLNGFYMQEPDATADADPATSEGVFVFTNLAPAVVSVGDLLRVSGTVIEFGAAPNTLTEIVTPTVTVLSTGNTLPSIIDVTLPVANLADFERYEGMRVRFLQTLTVSDHFDLAHFGELTLSANGRSLQPTNEIDPNDDPASGTTNLGNNLAAVAAFANLNSRSRIILDDANSQTYPPVIPFLDPIGNSLRLGSTVANLTGIFSQSFGSYRMFTTAAPAFTYAARPLTPPTVGGNAKVGSMNVLNYFNGNGLGAGFPTSRGANTLAEFNRQRAKVIAAVVGLDADVLGLLEIENDGNDANSSIQDLINGLNAATAPGTWAFIPDPAGYTATPGGSDQIRPAIIFKTTVVAPVGASATSSDTAFAIGRSPVAQTFKLLSNDETFALVVNHFKSKSSGGASGADLDQGDGQAAFNNRRKLQAAALVTFINTLTPTTPRVVTMGDFNAYEQEDPMDIMRAGGLSTIINNSYSYMFNGLSGSLDHALGTAALMSAVSGSGKWHINADEPVVLDYNVETKNTAGCVTSCTSPDFYVANAFRASDHDPVLVGLQLNGAQCLAGTYSATGNAPCTLASSGNFVATAGATSQTLCLAGTFQASTGQTSCGAAQPGSFVASAGATSQTACLAGTFQANAGATSCGQAQPGNVVANAGSTSQTACLIGTFQPNAGALSCNDAQPGNFVASAGATAQTQCAAGSFQAVTAQSSCGLAQPGFFVPTVGATSQTVCPAGTNSFSSGATSCTAVFNVTPSAGANGSISPSSVQSIAQGATTTFTVTPNSGFLSAVSGSCGGSLVGTTYTTSVITAGCSVIASFSAAVSSITTLSSSLSPSKAGQSVTFTAAVSGASGTPTGTVVFRDGANVIVGCESVALSGGISLCVTTGVSPGARLITATYSGNATYSASVSSALTQSVTPGGIAPVIYFLFED